jgi:hypothetical protein
MDFHKAARAGKQPQESEQSLGALPESTVCTATACRCILSAGATVALSTDNLIQSFGMSPMLCQIQGGQKYRPPKVDVNSPDLYIPLTAAWAYIMLIALNSLLLGKFKPDMMYNTVGGMARCAAATLLSCWGWS